MIKKEPTEKKGRVLVTFRLPSSMWAERVNAVTNYDLTSIDASRWRVTQEEWRVQWKARARLQYSMGDQENGELKPSFRRRSVVYYHQREGRPREAIQSGATAKGFGHPGNNQHNTEARRGQSYRRAFVTQVRWGQALIERRISLLDGRPE
jgi:hypothetical protein